MGVFFADSSAAVKRYVRETGSLWMRQLLQPGAGNTVVLCEISLVEVVSAITRKQRAGGLPSADASAALAQFRQELAHGFVTMPVTSVLLTVAAALAERHGLRAYDAVQLAACLELRNRQRAAGLPALTLVSADTDLNAAAATEGLLVEDPNVHP